MASELTCICLAFVLHNSEVTVPEDKINALIKAAGVNVEPFCPGFLICNVGAGGPAVAGGLVPSPTVAPAEEKKVEAKKEEFEESVDDMSFGFFD
ncbi:hypothetical protein JEQ12_020402 [Ovis aries]|uniref:60S acidic ribosomal protein P1-like n=1 Tax=Ovis aries TaxID=9940 RepID=A0A835ZJU6_SHEEP|nr:hypothetical protein JEQ12_020402 [Ovis aries]